MLLKTFCLWCAFLWLGGTVWAVTDAGPDVSAGVPRELARWRKERYRDVHYALRLVLAPNAAMLNGALTIKVTLDGPPQPIVLDWRVNTRPGELPAKVWGWHINGQTIDTIEEHNEHLTIPAALVKTGLNEISLQFASPIGTSGRAVTR